MYANNPEMAKKWEKENKLKREKHMKIRELIKKLVREELSETAKRDYKAEYKKFQSSTKSKKYRAELNAYNRKKGTYGNGDGKDASHKGGKIVGFEKESVNRGRAEKSRLKKEEKLTETVNKLNEKLSKSEIKKMRDKFDKTGKLPPHLMKLAKLMDKHTEVRNIVVPGLEWMSKLGEGKLNEIETFPPFEISKRMLKNKTFGVDWSKKTLKYFKGRGVSYKSLLKFLKKGGFKEKDVKGLWSMNLEGKLTEAIQPSKAINKVLDMADGGYGKLGGKLVDGLSANLFKAVYNKANDANKEKMNKMNEKQLYVFLTKLWTKFGKQVKL